MDALGDQDDEMCDLHHVRLQILTDSKPQTGILDLDNGRRDHCLSKLSAQEGPCSEVHRVWLTSLAAAPYCG